ncbi:YebC/PmpR family DNA-binding transcriptional regulator [Patescibacteria group bacterium]
MSGHSKWSTIKRKKGATDAKRGAVFTKIANMITITAREGGGVVANNPRLAVAIEKARQANMPKNNVERAIKRGTGELEGVQIESLQIEAYGPEGSAFIIEAITDNKNRTISEVRNILSSNNGKMAESGSVAYQFAKKGVIRIAGNGNLDEVELAAIDAGAEDTNITDKSLAVYTAPSDLQTVKEKLKNATIESAEIEYLPQNPVDIAGDNETKINNLASALNEHDDVNDVYSNVE